MAKRRKTIAPEAVRDGVEAILADDQITWFPVKHFSATCAAQLKAVIEALQPAAVLVEGPDDATALIPHMVDPATQPPFTVFSSYTDTRNRFELNGVLSPAEDVPARFRAWWPFTAFCPEYVALKQGHAVGAELAFIDIPLTARIPVFHAPRGEEEERISDRHLEASRYFQALAAKKRMRSLDEFWDATFEVAGISATPEAFRRAVLTFAWCARHAGGEADQATLGVDGTTLREQHMRWHIDAFTKKYPDRPIVVVTGAFHTVALPWTKRAKAKYPKDKNLETLVTPHSFRALSRLYHLERMPGYSQAVWDAMEAGAERPFDTAGMGLLVEVMRSARGKKEAVSTADAVGAWQAAQNLSRLRGNAQVTLHDLLDAAQMGFVKGDQTLASGHIEAAAREVFVGHQHGRVTEAAGQAPLLSDFYAQAKTHRVDVTGASKTVRLNLHRQQKHRMKSAFLHQCEALDLPFFTELDRNHRSTKSHFKGADPATGENMHLISETWGVRWTEAVDDRLVALGDRGATVSAAAATLLRERFALVSDQAGEATHLLLSAAQMMLLELFAEALDLVEEAIAADARFAPLVDALSDFVLLQGYRDAIATRGHARVLETTRRAYNKALTVLPSLGNTKAEGQREILERIQTLARITLTFEVAEFDRGLFMEACRTLAEAQDANAALRGACFGVLYAFGGTRERPIADALLAYLRGTRERILQGGDFLDGLFQNARGIFLRSERLTEAISDVLAELDWETFKVLLPDLRRAFTQFMPQELDRIARRISAQLGMTERPSADAPVPEAVKHIGAQLDAQVAATLADWI